MRGSTREHSTEAEDPSAAAARFLYRESSLTRDFRSGERDAEKKPPLRSG